MSSRSSSGALSRAAAVVVESLESRRHLTSVKVNFQSGTSGVPSGFVADSGAVYAARGNGFSYGWNADNAANMVNDNTIVMIDQKYKTHALTQPGGVNRTWEIGLPNGQYQVKVVAGDYSNITSVYDVRVEGQQGPAGTPSRYNFWFEKTSVVNVTDGKLTLTNGTAASDQRLAYVEIIDVPSLTAPAAAATGLLARAASGTSVDLVWNDNSGNEHGFEVQRKLGSGAYVTIATTGGGNDYFDWATKGTFTDTGLAAGQTYTYRVRPVNAAGAAATWSNESTVVTPATNAQAAYGGTPRNVTDKIEIEDFDRGGSGIAYTDNTVGNFANLYRVTDVDVGVKPDGGYFVGWVNTNEWTNYTVTVPTTGTYEMSFTQATFDGGGKFHLELNGTQVGPQVTMQSTGAAFTFVDRVVSGFNLTAGTHVLKVKTDSAPAGIGEIGNIDWMKFTLVGGTVAQPTNLTVPGKTSSSVSLAWTDNATNETGYRVERKTGTGAWQTLAAGLAADTASYVDSTVAASTDYTYRVVAVSTALGDSPASNEVTTTTLATGTTSTFNVAADAYVRGAEHAANNYGTATELLAKWAYGPLHRETFLRFDLTQVPQTPSQVKLRLYGRRQSTVDGASVPFDVKAVSSTTWNESTITFNNKPAVGNTVGTINVVGTSDTWYELDITNYVAAERAAGRTAISLAIVGQVYDTDAIFYMASKESGVNKPQLAVTTQAAPATPSGLSITATTANSASLSWTYAAATGGEFRVERGTLDPATGNVTYATVGTVTWNGLATGYAYTDAAGLAEGTQYYYRVRAHQGGVDSTHAGPIATWTKLATPTAVAASSGSPTSVTVTWADNSGKETGFQVQYATDVNFADGSVSTVTVAGSNAGSRVVTGLTAGTQYYFRVRATNADVSSAYSASAAASTPGNLTITQSPAGNPGEGSTVQLTAAYASGSPVAGTTYAWTVLKNGASFVTGSGSSISLTPDDEGTYSASVVATSPSGETASGSLVVMAVNGAPTLTATGSGTGTTGVPYALNLAASDPSPTDVIGWTIDWGDGSTSTPTGRDLSPSHTYTTAGNYVISVSASDGTTTAAPAGGTIAVSIAAALTPPAAPSALSVVETTADRVDLLWTDALANEDGFHIERALHGGAYARIATVAAGVTTYSDTTVGLTEGTQYDYRVRAYNAAGESAAAGPVAPWTRLATPTAVTVTPESPTSVNVAWTDISQKETGFEVEYSTDTNFPVGAVTTIAVAGSNATNKLVNGLAPGTQYYFRLRATNADVSSAYSVSAAGTTLGSLAISRNPAGDEDEGSAVTLTAGYASGTPAADTTYAWTVVKNGVGLTTGSGNSITFTPDDQGTYVATVTATSPSGQTDSFSTTINVANVAPVLNVTGVGSATAGQPYTLQLSATDPSTVDTIGWTIDWGDGQSSTVTGRNASASHVYATAGNYSISGAATDGTAAASFGSSGLTVAVGAGQPGEPEVPQPPSAPTNASVSLASATEAVLTWAASIGNPATYSIYTSVDEGPYELYETVPASAATYSYMPGETTSVRFQISASNVGGESPKVNVIPSGGGTGPIVVGGSPQPAPTSVAQSGVGYTDGVTIDWQAAPNATGYVVEWSNGSEWFAIDETSGTSYTDAYPTLGGQQYRIVAIRGETNPVYSEPSPSVSVHPIAPPVAWYDDNAGANDRGTLSPFSVRHNDEDGITINVVPNDVDYDSNPIHIAGYEGPENGQVTLDSQTGVFTYIPNSDFVGTDTFTYWVNDGFADSEQATIAVDVTNAVPIATSARLNYSYADLYPAVEDGKFDLLRRFGALSASDADGDPVTLTVTKNPEHGTVDYNASTGLLTYTPDEDFNGSDSFLYTASDGLSTSSPARVQITAFGGESPFPGASPSDAASIWQETGTIWQEQGITPPKFALIETGFGMPYGNPVSLSIEEISAPQHGELDIYHTGGDGSPGEIYVRYTQDASYTGTDDAVIAFEIGNVKTKPVSFHFYPAQVDSYAPTLRGRPFGVAADAATGFTAAQAELMRLAPDPDNSHVELDEDAHHGAVTLASDGAFTYTPEYDPDSEAEPYVGWDFYSYTVISPDEPPQTQWVRLDVGAQQPQVLPAVNPLPFLPTAEGPAPAALGMAAMAAGAPSVSDLETGFAQAKGLLKDILAGLADLGRGVGQVRDASDLEILDKVDAATAPVDQIAEKYDQYVAKLVDLNKKAGAFLADQWYVSTRDYDAVANINKLPTKVGSLSASKEAMTKLAESLSDLGKGAGIAVHTANKVVTYAENTHAVLSAVEMAGGVSVLVKTGATLFVKEGFKACVKAASKELAQNVAQGVAADLAGHAAELAGIPPEQRQYIAIGVNAYQTFAFFKAAKVKIDPNGACFVAGTAVLSGVDANGHTYRKIEDIKVGDTVLSRDQHDASDDLDPRRVTQVFRRTSDHLRVLTVQDAAGNVETIKTTDEHPFYREGLGWTNAGHLTRGAVLDQPDGSDAFVVSSVREAHPNGIAVYNFEVEGDHTYFVKDDEGTVADAGDFGVWVHNTCDFKSEVIDRWSKKIGKKLPGDRQAHHIVPQNHPAAADLRDVLAGHDIDVNDAINGVPLHPKYHQGEVHFDTDVYVFNIETRILDAASSGGKAAIEAELDAIGMELLTGTFALD